MREYKHRGKRKDNGFWVYGNVVQTKYGVNIVDDSKWHEVDPETVGQYTGLKDKNGTEIYEGDLVDGNGYAAGMLKHWNYPNAKVNKENYVVRYHQASYKLFDLKGRWVAVLNHHVISKADELEVIGTRWDNPELLGEVRD